MEQSGGHLPWVRPFSGVSPVREASLPGSPVIKPRGYPSFGAAWGHAAAASGMVALAHPDLSLQSLPGTSSFPHACKLGVAVNVVINIPYPGFICCILMQRTLMTRPLFSVFTKCDSCISDRIQR